MIFLIERNNQVIFLIKRKPQQIKEEGLRRLNSVIRNTVYYFLSRKSEKSLYLSISLREQPKKNHFLFKNSLGKIILTMVGKI